MRDWSSRDLTRTLWLPARLILIQGDHPDRPNNQKGSTLSISFLATSTKFRNRNERIGNVTVATQAGRADGPPALAGVKTGTG